MTAINAKRAGETHYSIQIKILIKTSCKFKKKTFFFERITLFKAIEISKHIIGEDRDESSCVNLNDKDLCHNEIYIKPQGWFEEKLSEMNGKVIKGSFLFFKLKLRSWNSRFRFFPDKLP